MFTDAELDFLRSNRLLARIATVGPDGTPHVAPVGWSLADDARAIVVGGRDLARTKKYRDLARHDRVALVIDHVLPPWRPQGVEVRGRAELVAEPQPHIVVHPERIVGWGLDGDGRPNARDVGTATA